MTEERRERVQKRIERLEAVLDKYYEAEIVLVEGGQQYSLGSRSLTRANLAEVRRAIVDTEKLIDRLKNEVNGGGRNLQIAVIPIDY
jgi:hypothetical protein